MKKPVGSLCAVCLVIVMMLFVTGCEDVPPEMQPLIYYSFDDDSGDTVTDVSGNDNHGTLVGTAGWSSEGRYGKALLLPGTEGYVRLPNNVIQDMTSMTVACWVNCATNELWSRVFDFAGTKGFMYLTLNSGDPEGHTRFSIYAGNPQAEPILTCPVEEVPINTWIHIAVTVSPEEYCFYINGENKATLSTTHLPMDIGVDEMNANYLGKSQFADPYFNGLIDEFYLFNRELSEEEIVALSEFNNN